MPSQLSPEDLIDRVIDLELPTTLKSKHKEALDSRMGNVRLRLLYSKEHEIPLRPPPNASSVFSYRDHYTQMRTGDLILYSGVGSTDAVAKILSGIRYSRVGTIVRMPNKYTGVEKIYVFEATRNLGRELDAFVETAHDGPALYELFPHLHAVSATDIWWVPLKAPIDPTASANMVDWIKEVVCKRQSAELPSVPPEVDEFFNRYELSLLKHPYAYAELCSASVAAQALRLGGLRMPFTSFISAAQLISSDCFENPVIIRERSQTPMPSFYPPGMDLSMRAPTRRITVQGAPRDASPGGVNGAAPPDMIELHGNTIVAPKLRSSSVAPGPASRGQSPAPSFMEDHEASKPPEYQNAAIGVKVPDSPPKQEDHELVSLKTMDPPAHQYSQHLTSIVPPPQQAQPQEAQLAPLPPQQYQQAQQPQQPPAVPPKRRSQPPSYEIQFEEEASSPVERSGFHMNTLVPPSRGYRQHGDLPSQPPGPSRVGLQPMVVGLSSDEQQSGDDSPASNQSSPRRPEEASSVSPGDEHALHPPSEVPPTPIGLSLLDSAVSPPPLAAKPSKPPKPPKKPRDARPLTQKPGALSTASKDEAMVAAAGASATARPRAVTSNNKPRALAVPTARGLNVPEGDDADGATQEVVNGDGPSYPLPEDEIVSPKTKRKTPRGSRPSKRDEDGADKKSEGKKTKRKGKESDSPRADSSSPTSPREEDATAGSSTPEAERKKRKVKANAPPPVPLKPTTLRAAPSLPPSPRDLQPDSPHDEAQAAAELSGVVLDSFKPQSARVQWSFDAMSETEISVPEGKTVTVLGVSEEWALVEYDGRKGAVPVAYLLMNAAS